MLQIIDHDMSNFLNNVQSIIDELKLTLINDDHEKM